MEGVSEDEVRGLGNDCQVMDIRMRMEEVKVENGRDDL